MGSSRGGRTSKLHGLTDDRGRPRVLLISAGNINYMTMAGTLIDAAAGRFDRRLPTKATIQRLFALRSPRLAPRW